MSKRASGGGYRSPESRQADAMERIAETLERLEERFDVLEEMLGEQHDG